jgi:hypothetical protein
MLIDLIVTTASPAVADENATTTPSVTVVPVSTDVVAPCPAYVTPVANDDGVFVVTPVVAVKVVALAASVTVVIVFTALITAPVASTL